MGTLGVFSMHLYHRLMATIDSVKSSVLPQIAEYTVLTQLYKGTRTAVYRAVHNESQRSVVIKVLSQAYPSFNELTHFRNQYIVTQTLNIPGVVKPLALVPWCNGYALVMEDFGGRSLQAYAAEQPAAQKKIGVVETLAIAIQIADILGELSQHHIVHKDIKPANVLIRSDSKQIQLIDFSISTQLPKESPENKSPNVLEGSLAYLAPEQTGRMNRGIDYRTDFYGLGVTLYELLTGHLPFISTDPLALIHCHIAKAPVSPSEMNAEIPQMVSQIVLKLMAKNAEDRYQSAVGLKHDLTRCLHALKDDGKVEAFELGDRDISDRFLIPEKLYGREAEVKTLLSAFDRIADGQSEMMLVAGFSGMGKTAVVKEVLKPTTRQQGYFIQGKFDQFNRSLPFSAFMQALRSLIKQLLAESDAQLLLWRENVLQALGENGQVLVDVLPELEKLIGPQPPVIELSGSERQNRFHRLLEQFMQVFATPTHPLVIFLDDLQWADLASLDLIERLMQQKDGYLLLLGAYRDNEVSAAHPMLLMVDSLKKANRQLETIALGPLSEADINQLTADTLKCSQTAAAPLSALIYQTAKGNPFFSMQLFKSLRSDGLIEFDPIHRSWQCDITRVKRQVLSDDVVELMTQQLQKLSPECQHLLKVAACIGNQFELATLATVCEKPIFEAANVLWPALEAGFILPQSETYKFFRAAEALIDADKSLDKSRHTAGSAKEIGAEIANSAQLMQYKFLHDRVQQAAYALAAEDERRSIHLTIGQRLQATTPANEQADRLFAIANHLNRAHRLLDGAAQLALAQLNLQAGRKAKGSTAYEAAIEFFQAGVDLLDWLSENAWEHHYELMLALHADAAEAAYLSTDFAAMARWAAAALEQSRSLLDTAKIQRTLLFGKKAQGEMLAALQIGRQVLSALGITFPRSPTQEDIGKSFEATRQLWAAQETLSLLDLPPMEDTNYKIAMEILSVMVSPAYIAAPSFMPLIIFKLVELSIKHGNCPNSIYAYADYGLILCGVIGDISAGYDFGQLALKLLDQLQAKAFTCRGLYIVNTYIDHWKVPLQGSVLQLQKAYQRGLETGDIEIGSLSAAAYCQYAYHAGQELLGLSKEMAAYQTAICQLKQTIPQYYVKIYRQTVLNLLGESDQPWQLTGSVFNADESLPVIEEINSRTALFYYHLNQMMLSYWFGKYEKAAELSDITEQYLDGGISLFLTPLYSAYDSLVQLALLHSQPKSMSDEKREERLARVEKQQNKLKGWAGFAPFNHQHRWQLVEAERYAVLGDRAAAIEAYESAIAEAKANHYIQDEACANERAAYFYLRWRKPKIAAGYLQEAYYAYSHWSAAAKVSDLEKRYPDLLAPILQSVEARINPFETIVSTETFSGALIETIQSTQRSTLHSTHATRSTTHLNEALDFAAVMQASQVLARTTDIDELLSQLTQIILKQSGSDRCALILADAEGVLHLEAIATSGYIDRTRTPLNNSSQLPEKLLNYVKNTQATVVIDNLKTDLPIVDSYLKKHQPKSVLCLPLLNQAQLIGLLYLQNQSASGVFTQQHIVALTFLAAQAAISLEKARLYQQLQSYAQQLENSQLQTVQTEKMASLGNLVAGVAHEINNPIGFLNGSIRNAQCYLEDLLDHMSLYQTTYPQFNQLVADSAEDIDLEFVTEDFPKLLKSMTAANNRIKAISTSLRTFSRADTEHKTSANLQEGLDSTLLILKYRLKPNEHRPAIQVVQSYGEPMIVSCFPGQLNQVFMNILANAIDIFDEAAQQSSFAELEAAKANGEAHTITVTTKLLVAQNVAEIRIGDNGKGMPENVKARIFDYLYTTKGVGKGTGLGLAISHQIVTEAHGGQLTVNSAPGEGTEFCISLPL